MVTRNSKYYKKKGATTSERLRCPLCGKISEIGYFSQNHRFEVYKYVYAGRGKISVTEVKKPHEFREAITESIIQRFIDIIYEMTGKRYGQISDDYQTTKIPIKPPTKINVTPKIKPKIKVIIK